MAVVCLTIIGIWFVLMVLFCWAWYRIKEVGGRDDISEGH